MATFHQDAILSTAFAFAYAVCHQVGILQMPSPGDVGQALVPSRPPDAAFTDIHDTSRPLDPAAYSFDGNWIDAAKGDNAPTFGMVQLKTGLVWLYHLVTALVVQVTVIASDVISLKDRVTAVEGTQPPASAHGQETEALAQQVTELCERVASQEDRIADLELSQRAEAESYKKTIQELTTRLDDMKVDDDKKSRHDALERLCQSFKNFQHSMECQAARITGVKADTARKIALLQSGLEDVQAEVAAVKTVAVPVDVSSPTQAAKEVRKARVPTGVAQRTVDVEMAAETERPSCLSPVVGRSSARATVPQYRSTPSTSSGGSPITSPNHGKTDDTTVKNTKNTRRPLTIAHANVAQPGANKIPAIPIIPIPTISMERLIPAKSNGKENKPRNGSTTTLQDTKLFRPGAGQSPDVKGKYFTTSPNNKAQLSAGLPSKLSAPPKSRRSMLPAPRTSLLPSLAVGVDGNLSNKVKTADRLPGGPHTQTIRQKTVKSAPTAMSRPLSESASTLVEKAPPAVLPTSSSLAALDTALQMTWAEGDNLLTLVPALDCWNDDLSFSAITSTPMLMKTKRNTRYESVYAPPKKMSVKVKHTRSPLKSTYATLAENKGSLPASSSLAALNAALQSLHGQNDILTLMPGPEYASVDSSFSTVSPIFRVARPHCKRESIYLSPKRTSTVKPSRRL